MAWGLVEKMLAHKSFQKCSEMLSQAKLLVHSQSKHYIRTALPHSADATANLNTQINEHVLYLKTSVYHKRLAKQYDQTQQTTNC